MPTLQKINLVGIDEHGKTTIFSSEIFDKPIKVSTGKKCSLDLRNYDIVIEDQIGMVKTMSKTLLDHCIEWYTEQGIAMTDIHTEEGMDMYEKYVNWAFEEFGKLPV